MANPDPFLRSMALWILKDFTGSLNTLVQTNVGTMHPQYNDEEKQETSAGIFKYNLYFHEYPIYIFIFIIYSKSKCVQFLCLSSDTSIINKTLFSIYLSR
jgi:hypothetical protein